MVGTVELAVVMTLTFVSGALAWTFAEYALHRFWGHGPFRFGLFYREHTRHHAEGHYMTPALLKWGFAVGLFTGILGLGLFMNQLYLSIAFGAGFSSAYGYYEYFHWSLHQYAATSGYGRWARRHHFYHHFHEPKMNHGVTSPLWDIVFGTYRSVLKPVRVPQKLAMKWMSLEQRWPGDFALRGQGGQ